MARGKPRIRNRRAPSYCRGPQHKGRYHVQYIGVGLAGILNAQARLLGVNIQAQGPVCTGALVLSIQVKRLFSISALPIPDQALPVTLSLYDVSGVYYADYQRSIQQPPDYWTRAQTAAPLLKPTRQFQTR